MADIKFRCPECSQKISVDGAAIGVRIDCPSCRSTLIIPPSSDAPVVAITRRKLAVVSGSADGLYKEIEQKQAELAAAIAESQQIREVARQAEETAEAALAERGKLIADRERYRSANEEAAVELEKLRNQLTATASERDALRRRTQDSALVQGGDSNAVVDRLRAELAALEKERDELAVKLTAIAPLREQLNAMVQERDELISRVSEASGETEVLRKDSEGQRAELGALQSKLVQIERRALEAESKVGAFTRERDEWKAKAAATEFLPAELLAAKDDTQKMRSQFGELARALDAARLDRDQALAVAADREKALALLSSTAEAARKELAVLRAEADTGLEERERLKASTEEFQEEARELQQRVDTLLDDLHAREHEVGELKKAGASATKSAKTRDEELARLRATLTERERELASLSSRLEDITGRLSAKDIELAQALGKLEDVSRRLAESEKELSERAHAAIQSNDKEAQARIAEAERAVLSAEEKSRFAEGERIRLTEQLAKSTADLGAMQEQVRRLQTEKEQARARVNEVEAQLEQHFDQFHAVESERNALRADLEGARLGLDRAKQHVSVLQARRDVMREEINRFRERLGMPPDAPAA